MKIDITDFHNLPFGFCAVCRDAITDRQFLVWSTVRGTLIDCKRATGTLSLRYTVIGYAKVAVTPLEIVEELDNE